MTTEFLIKIIHLIAQILAYLLNIFQTKGIFPDVQDYQNSTRLQMVPLIQCRVIGPFISFLPYVKIFEVVMLKHRSNHFEIYHILVPVQFDFRRAKLTVVAAVESLLQHAYLGWF